MRKLLQIAAAIYVIVLLPLLCSAQLPQYQGFCQAGGQQVNTQGLLSSTRVQASYPFCTVTVRNAGTATISTIFSTTGGGALGNPFTANIDGSFLFFAANTICYDVTISGGTPNTMPAPFTFSNVCLAGSGGGGGGGGVPGGAVGDLQTNAGGGIFGGITSVIPGSAITSKGTGTPPGYQTKVIYDVRDWMTCDTPVGTSTGTDATSGMNTLLNSIDSNEATIQFRGTTNTTDTCKIGNTFFPANVTLDFSPGGAFTLISSTTPPGGAGFINGTSAECELGPTHTTCSTANAAFGSTTLAITTGNTVVVVAAPYPGFTFKFTKVTDNCNNFYIHVQQSTPGQPRNTGAWVASGVNGGTCTITATANGGLTHSEVMVSQWSGMGPVVSNDGKGATNNGTGTTMTAGPATVTAGSLVLGYGGQQFTAETCTAGAGYVQPAGLAGQTTNGLQCMEYQLASAGGSQSVTHTITSGPLGSWVYNMLPLKPGNATATIWGSIVDPDLHQIFYNADSGTGHGVIDFTGAAILDKVYPEWWGASNNATAAVNTPALQAAVWAAFGGGLTQARTNSSGLNVYNRPLYLTSNYSINDELKWYDVINFKVVCAGRLNSGITQTGTNKRIINGQSVAYGEFYDCGWTGNASNTGPLIDLDYDGVTTVNDLRPQFLDFYNNTFIGSSVTDVGVLIAKSGGGAQGSNIYCYNCAAQGFTGAAWQAGGNNSGRNLGRNYALNALDIGWYGGDIQSSPLYGIAGYGAGYIFAFGTSMENGFSTQTGFDIYVEGGQGPCVVEGVRSESRRLAACNYLDIKDSGTGSGQMGYPTPGASFPVGSVMGGDPQGIGWDGRYYKVTINTHGFNGAGTPALPIIASSGTATSITDTNQNVTGSNTTGTFVVLETVTQAVTGSTATLRNTPVSTGTITGSVTSGTIGSGHTMTQAVTGVTCTSSNAPVGSQSLTCTAFSGTADNSHVWTDGITLGTYTPTAAPAFSAVTMLISAATGVPDNANNWTGGTSGAVFVPTTVPTNVVNFTVNAFNGMLMAVMAGTANGCYGVVTANTASSITFGAGLVTRYAQLSCPNPDLTSSFIVEPNWNNGTVVDDNVPGCAPCMTMVSLNEDAIDGGLSPTPAAAQGVLDNVTAPGGQLKIDPRNTILRKVQVTRADWYNAAGGYSQSSQVSHDWDVNIAPALSRGGASYYETWFYPFNGGGQRTFVGAFHRDLGTNSLTWSCSQPGGGLACNDTWIGGRSDPNALVDATRNILEYGGMLGRAAPFGTDLAGSSSDITGGPSTGTGLGGAINFWTSNPTGSSSTVNSGLKRWLVSAAGHWLTGLDNTYDIGAAGATRPRRVYVGTDFVGPIGATTPSTGSFTTLTVGSGTAVALIKFATDTPGAITVNAGTCTDRGVAIAGSSTTATIQISAAYALDANILVSPAQSVAGTAHYRLCNPTGANITLNAAAAFNISVIQ